MELPQSILWGFLPGLVTSCIGAYKDTLYEEFEIKKFFRSTIITFLWYIVINYIYPKEPVLYKAIHKPAPGKFKNCTCENGKCIVHKDRGWILDRVSGKQTNYDGILQMS